MIWDEQYINTPLTGNSQWIMGFNEPEYAWQAGLTPEQGATYWRQIEQLYPTRKLLSPATAEEDNSHWLVNFRNAYMAANNNTPPRLDGLAVHCFRWYASQCIDFTQQYINWANSWGVPEVWVTEFSFAVTSPSSPSRSLQEQQLFINWMAAQPKVTRYAWFANKMVGNEWWYMPAFPTPLVDFNTGQLTSYGNVYLPYR